MRLAVSVIAAVLLAVCNAVTVQKGHNAAQAKSYGYIIELNSGESLGKRNIDVHSEFHKRAQDIGTAYKVRHEFKDPGFFYGLSIDNTSFTNIDAILALPEVKNIWPNRYHDRPAPVESFPMNATFKPATLNKRGPIEVARVNGTSDVNAHLKLTGVDTMHELGFRGKGVKIAFIDSGVDYRHPALGGGIGEGFKIAGGYDFVGDAYDGENAPIPDDDPLVECLKGGHGTHVAGIIAAEDPAGVGFGIVGVAPDASLYAYRILGCEGGVTDDVIIQGFEGAAAQGVDLISMSVGGPRVWETSSAYATVFASLKSRGIGLIVSAGNDGPVGPYFASWPALDPSIIAVGSVSNTKQTNMYTASDSVGNAIEYARIFPMDPTQQYHVFIADMVDDIACDYDAWMNAAAEFDPTKIIAVMRDNSWCLEEVEYLTIRTGITRLWLYRNADQDLTLYSPGYIPLDVVRFYKSQADIIAAGIAAQGSSYTLTFENQTVHDKQQPTARTVSSFSTFGPTMEMSLKPQLSAPGGNILSTWPAPDGMGYAIISGTSMSTPHVAGCYALLKQVNPQLTPDEILYRLQSTSTPLEQYKEKGILTTTVQQGSGLISVFSAMMADSYITPNQISLRDIPAPPPQEITIENKSLVPKTYTINHKGASQVNTCPNIYTELDETAMWNYSPNNQAIYASASFSEDQVVVQPGAKATFTATITAPSGLNPDFLPLYGGYITISDGVQEYVVPYAGVPYVRSLQSTLDFSDLMDAQLKPLPPAGVPSVPYVRNLWLDRNNDLMEFTFPAPAPPPDSDADQEDNNNVLFMFVIRQPSAYIRLDVVHAHQKVHPDRYGFDRCTRFETNDPTIDTVEEFAGIPSYGMIYSFIGGFDKPYAPWGFQELYTGFGNYLQTWQWAEVVAPNGTWYQLPNNDYRVLLRALKPGYDWKDPTGYESWLSPIIRVNITDPGYPNPFHI